MARRKKKALKRKKRTPGKSRLPLIAGLLYRAFPYIVIIVLAVSASKAVSLLLLNSSYFKIDNIEILCDGPAGIVSDISARLESERGANIFKTGLKRCESAIEKAHPELKNVVVRRSLPDTLLVTCDIRKPVCQVYSGYYYLVSGDATILPGSQSMQDPDLTVVTGVRISARKLAPISSSYAKGLDRAIEIIKDIRDTDFMQRYEKLTKINVYDSRNPVLFLGDGTRIELGEFGFKQKQRILEEIMDELKAKKERARVIDLRFDDVVVIPG